VAFCWSRDREGVVGRPAPRIGILTLLARDGATIGAMVVITPLGSGDWKRRPTGVAFAGLETEIGAVVLLA